MDKRLVFFQECIISKTKSQQQVHRDVTPNHYTQFGGYVEHHDDEKQAVGEKSAKNDRSAYITHSFVPG